jgi:hypothetical protein
VKPQPTRAVPRFALTREEAAAAVGVSLSHFERHIQPDLKIIYSGSARLVPVSEVEGWTRREATLAGGASEPTAARNGHPDKRPGGA